MEHKWLSALQATLQRTAQRTQMSKVCLSKQINRVTHVKQRRLCIQPVPTLASKGKAIPLQALTGPECSRKLRLPDFKTIGTLRW
jgi:hypothetical protein